MNNACIFQLPRALAASEMEIHKTVCSCSQAQPLIQVGENGELTLHDKALQVLEDQDEKMQFVIVSMVGHHGSEKSLLTNLLSGNKYGR